MLVDATIGNGSVKFLIDCGPTVYSNLVKQGKADDIDHVVITSATEGSLGSLGTLVSHLHYGRANSRKAYPNSFITVICGPILAATIRTYLYDICGLSEEVVVVESAIALPSVDLQFFVTERRVSPFIMKFGQITLVHSGNAMTSFFDYLGEQQLDELRSNSSNTIIFHSASISEELGCPFTSLSNWSEEFKNFFIFGHNKEDGAKMVFSERYMRSLSTNDGNNEFTIEKQLGT